jgi:hypothetical protein
MYRSALLALLVAGSWLSAAHTLAARYIRVTVKQNGVEVLRTGTGDNGRIPPETVWTYLKDVRFRQRYAQRNYQIVPDKDNPDQATFAGKIEVIVKYGGQAKLEQIRLLRVKKSKGDAEWVIHPDDYKRLLELRDPRSSSQHEAKNRAAVRAAHP